MREIIVMDVVGKSDGGYQSGGTKVPVAERDGPWRSIDAEEGCPRGVVIGAVDCLRLDPRVGMLAIVRILGNKDVVHGLLGKKFWNPL